MHLMTSRFILRLMDANKGIMLKNRISPIMVMLLPAVIIYMGTFITVNYPCIHLGPGGIALQYGNVR